MGKNTRRSWDAATTVSLLFRESASAFADREAVVAPETRLSYAQFAGAVSGLASKLQAIGARGERVAMLMGNGAAIVVAYYGTWEAGAQAVPLNPDYTDRELSEILEDAQVRLVVCGSAQRERVASLATRFVPGGTLVLDDADIGGLDASPTGVSAPLPAPDAPAILQYTGGTTGRAKGVMLTHGTVAANVLQRDARIPMREGAERILCVTPLFHAYATAMALFPALSHAGTLVILPRFKPEAVFDAIEREKVTLFAGAPAIYNALVSHPEFERRDLSSLSASFSGSAPLAVEVLERWQTVSGAPILEGYGLTEASPILTFNPRHGTRKVGSVGPAVEGTEVEIVDPVQAGVHLGTGVVGEVRARGPQLMVGYRNRPKETAEAIRDGWLYTGDLGELDEDGYLFIRGRKKDMVIVGGFNVYPREIEEVLFTLKGVKDCGAVGVPDSYRGEVIHAFVVPEQGIPIAEDEAIAHCSRNLARYKVPARIHFVAEVPRTAVGKLDRLALGRLAAEKLGGKTR
jgi:long-chain acyl-CoA synthetase